MSKNMEEVYTVNGFTGTLTQICINLGLPYNTIKGRLFRGMTIEAALSKPIVNKNNNRKVYTVDDFTGSLTEVCNHFGVSYSAVLKRISRGVPIEDAIKISVQKREKNKIYSVNGFTGTLKQVCEHFEVSYDLVRDRIRRGRTPEEAVFNLGSKRQVQQDEVYTVNNFTGTIGQICKHFDVPRPSVVYCMSKGMSLEEAIKDPIKKSKLYEVNGFVGTVQQISNHFGIPKVTIYARLRGGLSIEEAVKTTISEAKLYEVNGFVGTLQQVCDHFGLSRGTIHTRLSRGGLSMEEAVNVPLMKIPTTWRYKGQKLSLKEICKIENRNFVEVYNSLKCCHTLEYSLKNASTGYSEE